MKMREFKDYLNNLPDEELDKELGYKSRYMSGVVLAIKTCEEDLYYKGDDDPSELYTKQQLVDDGYEEDEINDMIIEFHQGDYLFEF